MRKHFCWIVIALILINFGPLLGAGTATGDSQGPAFTVRMAVARKVSRMSGRLTLRVNSQELMLLDEDGSTLAIPFDQMSIVFYDRGLHRKFLKKAAKGTANGQFGRRTSKAAVNAAIGAGTFTGMMATSGGVLLGVLPLAAFPPALVAIGGVAAFTIVKANSRDHFMHIVWEHDMGLSAVALKIPDWEHVSLLSAWRRVSTVPCTDLVKERKAWRRAKRDSRPMRLTKAARFGDASLNEGKYKIAFVNDDGTRGRVCFFRTGKGGPRNIIAIVPVRIQPSNEDLGEGVLIGKVDGHGQIGHIGISDKLLFPISQVAG